MVERKLVGEFIDAAVNDQVVATRLLAAEPGLREAHWNLGQTALHFLTVEGFTEAVAFCLEHRFDPNATNVFGDTPLSDACVLGNTAIARLLIEHGADLDVMSDTNDCPLHCCIRNSDADLLDLLLAAGSNPYYVTELGETIFDNWSNDADQQTKIADVLAKHHVAKWREP